MRLENLLEPQNISATEEEPELLYFEFLIKAGRLFNELNQIDRYIHRYNNSS